MARGDSYDYGYGYPRRQTRETADGIRARTRNFASAWWSKQWMAALNGFGWSNRLERGRAYARKGQVLDFTVTAGVLYARVQGSRVKPYNVAITLTPLDDATWDRVLDELGLRAEFTARLLTGEMPHDVESAFGAAGAALLPSRPGDLKAQCSCPDIANPCKHIAAVHYIVAEALDADPFLLFAMRGRSRDAVLDAFRKRRAQPDGGGDAGGSEAERADADVRAGAAGRTDASAGARVDAPEPLVMENFWGAGNTDALAHLDPGLCAPPVRASLLRRLGAIGAWTTPDEVVSVFAPTLGAASDEVLRETIGTQASRSASTGKARRSTGPGR